MWQMILVTLIIMSIVVAACAVAETDKADVTVVNTGRLDVYWHYFGDEADVIRKAGERNGLNESGIRLLFAIRKAENGHLGMEFGIMNSAANNLDKQAGWAAATIKKNYERWVAAGQPDDFVIFLGRRYCPVGADNDPSGLNKNWVRLVKYFYHKLKNPV